MRLKMLIASLFRKVIKVIGIKEKLLIPIYNILSKKINITLYDLYCVSFFKLISFMIIVKKHNLTSIYYI